MTELNEFDGYINEFLDKLEKDIKNFDKKDPTQKNKHLKSCQDQLKTIQNQLNAYELEIGSLQVEQQIKYKHSYKNLELRYTKLKNEVNIKKQEGMTQEQLFANRASEQDEFIEAKNLNSKQAIELGVRLNNKIDDAINGIIGKAEYFDQQADLINKELDDQINQLELIYNTTKETQVVLKSTQKLINYFARNIMTDKIIRCLVCVVFLAILVIIIIGALGLDDGKLNLPDEVKKEKSTQDSSTDNKLRILLNLFIPN